MIMIMSMLIIIIVISKVMTDDNKAVITIQEDNFHPTTINVSLYESDLLWCKGQKMMAMISIKVFW